MEKEIIERESIILENGEVAINATPHELNIERKDGVIEKIKTSGIVPRLKTETRIVGETPTGIIVREEVQGGVEGLPEEKPGIKWVVPRLVAKELLGVRKDLLVPGNLIRDNEGKIIGAEGITVLVKE